MARNNAGDDTITGIHPVAEALAAGESIDRIVIGAHRERDPALAGIIASARAANIPVAFEPEGAFRRFGNERHQHVAATVKRFAYAAWSDVRAAAREDERALVVALDHIEDPHNLGAIIRNSDGAGVTAVVIPDRRSASVTPAARRAAAGAASHIPVVTVPNLVRALEDLKADGCWVYGLSTGQGSVTYTQIDYTGRCVFVVGAEGKGLSRLVAERCDQLARIPLSGKVASLNASSSAAIVLFETLRQRAQRDGLAYEKQAPPLVNP
jgi:23S rRNA (guanosine2251-2'-O)-methyltransferase